MKIFVVVAVKKELACVGSLFVNTKINPNLFPSPELRTLHLPLSHSDYDFLDHDSFLDCSQIKEINLKWLFRQVERDPGVFLGRLNKPTFQKAKEIILSAPTIPEQTKKRFLF